MGGAKYVEAIKANWGCVATIGSVAPGIGGILVIIVALCRRPNCSDLPLDIAFGSMCWVAFCGVFCAMVAVWSSGQSVVVRLLFSVLVIICSAIQVLFAMLITGMILVLREGITGLH